MPECYFFSSLLDVRERVLLRDGRLVPLAPKALSTLLLQNMGHVVEKDVLMSEVWPDEDVEEGNLAQHVFMVRRALGETNESPEYIETIPRRGYRFISQMIESRENELVEADSDRRTSRQNNRRSSDRVNAQAILQTSQSSGLDDQPERQITGDYGEDSLPLIRPILKVATAGASTRGKA